jgi:NAD(P)H-dependent FMN reductase
MRILALNGSHRGRRGATQALLDRMERGAREGGAEFETVVLAEKEIRRCLGCEACQAAPGLGECVLGGKDDAAAVFSSMRGADILVFATPVYVFGMSSLLKSLIERFNSECDAGDVRVTRSGLVFHHVDAALCSKPFVLVACSDNIEAETPRSVVEYFKTYSRFMDAPMLAALPRSGAFLLDPKGGDMRGGRTEPSAVEPALEAFREAGLDLARRGRVAPSIVRRATRRIVPIPAAIKMLMSFKPLKARLIAEGIRRGAIRQRLPRISKEGGRG